MVERSSANGVGMSGGSTVSFGEHYLGSGRFQAIYREGMMLVEETARYLDGDGRQEGRVLVGAAAVSYATESMRLTTRLMNLASWLLIRRSVNAGEMTGERARRERLRLKIDPIGRPSHVKAYDELPARLRTLIEASFIFQDKIVKLDRLFEGGAVLAGSETQAVAPPRRGDVRQIRLVFSAD